MESHVLSQHSCDSIVLCECFDYPWHEHGPEFRDYLWPIPGIFGVHDLTFRTRLPKWNSDISNMSRLILTVKECVACIGWKWTATVNGLETESYLKVINVIAGVNNIFLDVSKTIQTTTWQKWGWLCSEQVWLHSKVIHLGNQVIIQPRNR